MTSHATPARRAAFCVLAISVLITATGSAQPQDAQTHDEHPTTAPVVVTTQPLGSRVADQFAQVFAFDHEKDPDGFQQRVRNVARHLPVLEIPGGAGSAAQWYTVALNPASVGFGGFRFRTPVGEGKVDLSWSFVIPRGRVAVWYILNMDGPMEGFKNFKFYDATEYDVPQIEGAGQSSVVIQELDDLEPDSEYVIWFKLRKPTEPLDAHVALALTPAGTNRPPAMRLLGIYPKK